MCSRHYTNLRVLDASPIPVPVAMLMSTLILAWHAINCSFITGDR